MTVPSRYPGYGAGSVGRTLPTRKPSGPVVIKAVIISACCAIGLIVAVVFAVRFGFQQLREERWHEARLRGGPSLAETIWNESPDEISVGGRGGGSGAGRSAFDLRIPEGPAAYSQGDIDRWLPEMLKEVEATAGRAFKYVPPARVISRNELRRLLVPDYGEGAEFLDDLPGEVEMTAIAVLGLYDPDKRMVYMIPGNLSGMMGQGSPELVQAVAKLVLAHELAHALQDQHLDLKRMQDAVKNMEEGQALRATIEGHATMVEDLIAERMGLIKVRAGDDDFAVSSDDDFIEAMLAYQDLVVELYYEKGGAFLDHNLKRGGQSQVWRILSQPPKNTAPFMNPARYWQPGQGMANAEMLLADLSSYFGMTSLDGWEEQRFELGAFTMRLMYRRMRASQADAMVSKVQNAQALILGGSRYGEIAGVVVFELRPGSDATNFIRTLEQVAPGIMTPPESSSTYSITNPQLRKLPGIEADVSREMKFDYTQGGRSGAGRVVRIARGNRIVEITHAGFEVDDKRVIELANEVFRRLNK